MSGQGKAPAPVYDKIVRLKRPGLRTDPLEGQLTEVWSEYFTQVSSEIDLASSRVSSVTLTLQGAAIGATDISDGSLAAGFYRITYYARITQAATTSSSLTVSFDWIDQTITCSQSGAAMTGNTTSTLQTGSLLVYTDSASPVRYETAYASVGATPMQYKLYVALERVEL